SPTADIPPDSAATIVAKVREPEPRAGEPTPPRPDPVDQSGGERPSKSVAAPARADREDNPMLEIAALRLCSGVKDFGDIHPMTPDAIRPGRDVLVYCEMSGLEWEPCDKGFAWRLAAHLELRSGMEGRIVWEQALGTAKFEYHRRRHDNFLSYRI